MFKDECEVIKVVNKPYQTDDKRFWSLDVICNSHELINTTEVIKTSTLEEAQLIDVGYTFIK